MSQALLGTGEDRFVVACFQIDDAVRLKPSLRKRWSEEIWAREGPEDLSMCAGYDSSRK